MNFFAAAEFSQDRRDGAVSVPRGLSRTHVLLEALGRSIVSGRYPVEGVDVAEADLCQFFGVSRGVLREAVRVIRSKGLVDLAPRRGLWVLPESNWNLLDPDILRWLLYRKPSGLLCSELTQARLAIEPAAASLAAQMDAGAKELVMTAMERAVAGEHECGALGGIIAWHTAVLHASRNRFLMPASGLIRTSLEWGDRHLSGAVSPTILNTCLLENAAGMIMRSDCDGAAAAMRDLIQTEMKLSIG